MTDWQMITAASLAAILLAVEEAIPVSRPDAYTVTKRLMDITVASALLLLTAPLILLLALLTKLDSPGAAFYARRVVGKDGRNFSMFKLRTMVAHAESILRRDENLRNSYLQKCKLENDPRVTRLGNILRKTSLDELPQLLNVIQGTMTLVGPRPIHAEEVDLYGPDVKLYKTVTPGLTGLWQVSGRSDTSYEWRVRLDMQYVRQRCILLDLSILLRTVVAVSRRRGAH